MSKIELPYNMDRSIPLVITYDSQVWQSSPSAQVLRKPWEREKAESGQVTSLVSYEPHSRFSGHSHPLGEEIFVLEGEFADENGRYPAGTYIRNPPGSYHTPFSEKGCRLFVKLNQFHGDDRKKVSIVTSLQKWQPGFGALQVMPLHEHKGRSTALVHWPRGAKFQFHHHWGGEEIFVLDGVFRDEHGVYPKGTWIRSPHLSSHNPFVEEPCTIFVKVGHL